MKKLTMILATVLILIGNIVNLNVFNFRTIPQCTDIAFYFWS
jgi:hypothetical protein